MTNDIWLSPSDIAIIRWALEKVEPDDCRYHTWDLDRVSELIKRLEAQL